METVELRDAGGERVLGFVQEFMRGLTYRLARASERTATVAVRCAEAAADAAKAGPQRSPTSVFIEERPRGVFDPRICPWTRGDCARKRLFHPA